MSFTANGFGQEDDRKYYKGNEFDIDADTDLISKESSKSGPNRTKAKGISEVCYNDDNATPADAGSSGGVTPGGKLEADDYPLRAEDIQNRIQVAQTQKFVKGLLSGYAEETQQMFWKYYAEGMTLQQIANEFNCSRSTVHRKLDTTMKQLRAVVKRKGLKHEDFTRIEPRSIYRKTRTGSWRSGSR
jgi:RNA polymerase sigma factor (sigma-70 family)